MEFQLRHAAGVVIHQHRLLIAVLTEVLLQLGQCVIHGRVQEAVNDAGGRAHVFALASGQLMREQHGQGTELMRWVLLEEDFLNPEFMGRVLDRVSETNHQRLGTCVN